MDEKKRNKINEKPYLAKKMYMWMSKAVQSTTHFEYNFYSNVKTNNKQGLKWIVLITWNNNFLQPKLFYLICIASYCCSLHYILFYSWASIDLKPKQNKKRNRKKVYLFISWNIKIQLQLVFSAITIRNNKNWYCHKVEEWESDTTRVTAVKRETSRRKKSTSISVRINSGIFDLSVQSGNKSL